MKRWLLFLAVACTKESPPRPVSQDAAVAPATPRATLTSIGPRLVSNQTSNPLAVVGLGLKTGMKLDVGGTVVPLTALDERHAYARLPAGIALPKDQIQVLADVKLDGTPTGKKLKLVNDTAFPVLAALAVNGARAYVASTTEDSVYAVELESKQVARIEVGDGPTALAAWRDGVVVAHRFSPELKVIDGAGQVKTLPAPNHVAAVLVQGDTLYVAEQARDSISALALGEGARELWRSPVAPNPGVLALTPRGLAVGSLQTGELELLDVATGKTLGAFEPGPKSAIVGPTTIGGDGPEMSPWVMNGSAPRALVFSAVDSRLFVAGIGPNIGPNPKRMEVSMNGGVSAVDLAKKDGVMTFVRHLGTGGGLTQALALDEQRGLLYGADLALGLVRVIDAKKLGGKDASAAARAVLQELSMEPPDGFPLVRPRADFAVNGRAGVALHSGPSALQLSADGKTLWVLNRFTGMLARVDVSKAGQKKAVVLEQLRLTDMLGGQESRRRGEVLYYSDLARGAVTCDACHPDGHTGGVLFEKTTPMRIYRSTTIRGALETPPYFTPASTQSIGETCEFVMTRNRYRNPVPTLTEVEDVTRYASAIVTLPNPFADASGAPPEELTLPDGRVSHPRKGLALFEGKAECAGCHPPPQFTTDQSPDTKGRYLDVGTPHLLSLREELQDPVFKGFGVPPLVGSWDVFPMLSTGAAGLEVEGERVRVDTRFPLRRAVADFAPKHGRAELLTPEELDDLLGYVQSL